MCPDFYTIRKIISLEKKEKEWFVGRPLLPEILGQLAPHWSKIAGVEPIFAHSTSAVTPSEKVQLTLIVKSTNHFPVSLR